MSLAMQLFHKQPTFVESVQANIRLLKHQGCICIHSVYGMSKDDFEKSVTFRKLTNINPERYFIGPSLCAGKMRGVGLWRRPLC